MAFIVVEDGIDEVERCTLGASSKLCTFLTLDVSSSLGRLNVSLIPEGPKIGLIRPSQAFLGIFGRFLPMEKGLHTVYKVG